MRSLYIQLGGRPPTWRTKIGFWFLGDEIKGIRESLEWTVHKTYELSDRIHVLERQARK